MRGGSAKSVDLGGWSWRVSSDCLAGALTARSAAPWVPQRQIRSERRSLDLRVRSMRVAVEHSAAVMIQPLMQ